jgi:repressor LexA
MDPNLTERQQEFLDFILAYHADNEYFPSLREIASHFKVSIGTVQTHMDYLKRKGALSWDKGKPRAFNISDSARKEPRASTLSEDLKNLLEGLIHVPVLGTVSAGPGLLAEENVEDTLTLPRNFLRYNTGDVFGLKVQGDSMIGAGINQGDLVLVRMQNDAQHGDIVVALLGEEALVKRFTKRMDESC